MKKNPINDVRRKINEVMKKHDEKVVVGWRPSYKKREEGDVWTDETGKEWTKKDGLIQSTSRLQEARMPLFCPECGRIMNHRHDTKFWRLRGHCKECVVKHETKLRVEGKYTEYREKIVRENYRAQLVDRIEELKDIRETVKAPEVLMDMGEGRMFTEKWDVDIEQVKRDIQQDIDYLEDMLEKFDNGELDGTSE